MNDAYFVAGLGYGDEGKGSIVDFLVEKTGAKSVVRYNGGPQAAHNVIADGIHHCYSQFGSGTFSPKVQTILSKHMLIDPLAIIAEEEALVKNGVKDAYGRLTINKDSIVITPMQKIAGQMKEIISRYGSCGRGVGETVRDSACFGNYIVTAGDLSDEEKLKLKLNFIWHAKKDIADQILEEDPLNSELKARYDKLRQKDLVELLTKAYLDFAKKVSISDNPFDYPAVFEGAQGVLLDVNHGFWPYITKTNTTFENAYSLVKKDCRIKKIGVLRAYSTRHGNGPFVTEHLDLCNAIPDIHNITNEWQGRFRTGWLDLIAASYALETVGGVDALAITNLDRLQKGGTVKICTSYEYSGEEDISKYFEIENINGKAKIRRIKSTGGYSAKERQKLTSSLYFCRPVYAEVQHYDPERFIEYISSELQTPVSIASFGPDRKDKVILDRGVI